VVQLQGAQFIIGTARESRTASTCCGSLPSQPWCAVWLLPSCRRTPGCPHCARSELPALRAVPDSPPKRQADHHCCMAARPGGLSELASKSQLCCWAGFQASAGAAPRPALPAPPRARTSKPPRPWSGARPSSPAQMPRRSLRVGTCSWPRVGMGTMARAAQPLRPLSACPGFPLFCNLAHSLEGGAVTRAAVPHPGCSRKPKGRGFPSASVEEVWAVRCGAPKPGLGWRSTQHQVGSQASLHGGTRGRLVLVKPVLTPRTEPGTSPARPSLGLGAGVRGGVHCAARKRKPPHSSNFAAERTERKLRGAAPGMVSGPPGRVGSSTQALRFLSYK
jgi:hypothetical protein